MRGASSARVWFVIGLLFATAANGVECDPGICSGNPCTITGVHYLAPGCRLDFSGKDVTVAAGARLIATTPVDTIIIMARSIRVEGSITVLAGFLALQAGNVTTAGAGTLRARRTSAQGYSSSEIRIVSEEVVLGGRLVSAHGDHATVSIEASRIAVNSRVVAQASKDVALIWMLSGGPIVTTKRVSARGTGSTARGEIAFVSNADLTVGARLEVKRAGLVMLHGRSVTVNADILADGIDAAPQLDVNSSGDVIIRSDVRVRGRHAGPQVGIIAGELRLEGTIDASYLGVGTPTSTAAVVVYALCRLLFPGALVAEGLGSSITLHTRITWT